MAASVTVTGGARLTKVLADIGSRLGSGSAVRVGFLEGATYPAQRSPRPKHGTAKVRTAPAASTGKTLPVAQVAFWNEFGTSRAPARPFFRNMIAAKSPMWGKDLAKALKTQQYSAPQALALMGERIKDQLTKSIVDFTTPANAPSTIARKGFDKPLVDTGVMQRSVDYVVDSK